MGQAPAGDTYNDDGAGLPLIAGAGDFRGNGILAKKYTTKPTKIVGPGEIVLSIRASIGAHVRTEHEYCLGRGVAAIIPDETRLDGQYLWHWLESAQRSLAAKGRGATFLQVSKADIADLDIPLPSHPEQRRIADILDRADDLRAKRRRALALLDLFVESLYVAMFSSGAIGSATAVTRKLSTVAKIKSGSTPNRKHAEFFGGGIPWVKTTEVHGDLILATEESVSVEGQKAARLQLFPVGSIVIAMYGQGKTRGQSAILGIDAAVNQACAVILSSEHFVVEFMGQQIRLSYERLRAKAQGGNQANLNLGLVGDLDVLVPSIEDQRDFVQQAKLVDELRINQTLELARLDELFASLQHRAFQGEL